MGLLERCREYVREKQRGSREVLIEERTQKEKRRGSRMGPDPLEGGVWWGRGKVPTG